MFKGFIDGLKKSFSGKDHLRNINKCSKCGEILVHLARQSAGGVVPPVRNDSWPGSSEAAQPCRKILGRAPDPGERARLVPRTGPGRRPSAPSVTKRLTIAR